MGRQQKTKAMLEPVLENYMGPQISYNTPRNGTKTAAPACKELQSAQTKQAKSSLNPLSCFGKLRDRYIKAMNEMAVGGDYTAMAGYQGCGAGTDYTMEHYRSGKEREIEALREELAALRRRSQEHQQAQLNSAVQDSSQLNSAPQSLVRYPLA